MTSGLMNKLKKMRLNKPALLQSKAHLLLKMLKMKIVTTTTTIILSIGMMMKMMKSELCVL